MITTKQRAYLRGLGSTLTPIFQIGKGGIEENFLIQVSQALEARELIKETVKHKMVDVFGSANKA